MARINVSVPDELAARIRAELPGLNVSQVLQEGLAARLDCRHDRLGCRRCAAQVERVELLEAALGGFYREALWEIGLLAHEGGTAEGACRVLKRVGQGFGLRIVDELPLPRPSRAARAAALEAKVAELPAPGTRRRRRRRGVA